LLSCRCVISCSPTPDVSIALMHHTLTNLAVHDHRRPTVLQSKRARRQVAGQQQACPSLQQLSAQRPSLQAERLSKAPRGGHLLRPLLATASFTAAPAGLSMVRSISPPLQQLSLLHLQCSCTSIQPQPHHQWAACIAILAHDGTQSDATACLAPTQAGAGPCPHASGHAPGG
jgi:hypothetical protein